MSVTTPVIAVMLAQRNRLIRALRERNARSESTAIPVDAVPRAHGRQFEHLLRLGIVRRRGDGHVFLDETALNTWKAGQSRRARQVLLAAIGAAALLAAIAYYLA